MRRTLATACLTLMLPCTAMALTIEVEGLAKDGEIHKTHAKCIATIDGKSTAGENIRPRVSWEGAPKGTLSYAIVVSDPDVPADLRLANKKDTTISKNDDRQTFYHWVHFNIPPEVHAMPAGSTFGYGTAAKNTVSNSPRYDGPCPPWNDEKLHHYHFKIIALDVKKIELESGADTLDALEAINAHSIGEVERVGTYTLNPTMRDGL